MRNAHPRPRRHGGGRSEHYAERRSIRGTTGQYAAEWSDAAAQATLDALHAGSRRMGTGICKRTEDVLRSGEAGIERFVVRECTGISTADRALAGTIIDAHAKRIEAATTRDARARRVRSFLKPLRERARARGRVEILCLTAHALPATTFHKWLAARPEEERLRPLSAGGRAHGGLIRWPLGWLTSPGVICYERAVGRLRAVDAAIAPDEDAMRLVLHTENLPTAVANAADHYLLVGPRGVARYWTVEEVARSFGIAARSRLMSAIVAPDVMTAVQAVECLGRGAHVGVVRCIIRSLVARGLLAKGASYGSAFSGLDCVAAAMDDELDGEWEYRFASERLPHARRGLLHAWGERGLKAERCYVDATGELALAEKGVDLWAVTPNCEAFSRRNRGRSQDGQRAALSEVWKSLGYARAATPRLILVENLAVPEASEPLTGLLRRLEGYRVETATLDPRSLLGEPVARERRFWVLRREP